MPGIGTSLEIFDKFIVIAKEIAKLPALVLPQYQEAARDMYRICQKLLLANENLSRWLLRFVYFDFRQQNGRGEFLRSLQEYRTMKSGPEYQQLKFSCSDISNVYYRQISSKIADWFSDKQKKEEIEGIFTSLASADSALVSFTYDEVIKRLDGFIVIVEQHVERGAIDNAEEERLKFKSDSRDIAGALEYFSGELSDLVIKFAQIARVPVTIGNP